MTIWDKIYKNYKNGGQAWASLSENIHPLFKESLRRLNFEKKYVLDLGCGTGSYLKLLETVGFKTDGVDSSKTAVKMTKKLLNSDAYISCSNMFDLQIPNNKYDFIISISTIHHGTKIQVKKLIGQIYNTIIKNGKIFITLPDYESSREWETFKNHKKISKRTFSPLSGPEKGLPHSFYSKQELIGLFSKFDDLKLNLDYKGRWIIEGIK